MAALAAIGMGQVAPDSPARRAQLVIVVDGLRPDYVTPELMPKLVALGRRGITFNAHHSVVPTVTRVNASSMATGTYPETHGLLGNTVYVPAVNQTRGLDTGSRENLEAIARADGRLLDAPSLGEILERQARKLLAVGSGTSGAVFLLNHTVGRGAIIHHEFARPPELDARMRERFGPPPAHALPNTAQNRRAVDAYLTLGLDQIRPDVTLMWISDPDTTAHTRGIGAASTREALALVDAEIGRIEDALTARGALDRTNIIVISDHGFSTHTATFALGALVAPFARPMPDGSPDVVVAEGAIHFRAGADPARVASIVAALQRRPEVGAVFTRPRSGGGPEGIVPGTLSFDVARWNHARAGEILAEGNWSGETNAAGYAGSTTQSGVAGHGASSPFDVHSTLIAAGPDFREHGVSNVPTSNADLAPTLLRLCGLDVPPTMTGRVIEEGFRNGPQPASVRLVMSAETVKTADDSYELTAHFTTAGNHRYLDYTEVKRK
jgi:arylsulfatase A-like enzyme